MVTDRWTQRLVWFILLLSVIVGIGTVVFIAIPQSSKCYSYNDVVARLWTCSGRVEDLDSSCCKEVQADVNDDCGWYKSDFCDCFGDAANQYCHVNFCLGKGYMLQTLSGKPAQRAQGSQMVVG